MEEITIKKIRPPMERNVERDIEWFCECFDIIRERDKDKSGFKIFKILLESAKEGEGLSINEITEEVELSRTAVVHHLRFMEESGIVVEKDRSYELRVIGLSMIVDEIERDIERSFEKIRKIAKDIDEDLGISFRE